MPFLAAAAPIAAKGAAAAGAAKGAAAAAGGVDLLGGLTAAGGAAGGAAQLSQALRGNQQQIQQASMQVPQAPEVMPLPQLNAPAPQQADLMSILAQIQGGNR